MSLKSVRWIAAALLLAWGASIGMAQESTAQKPAAANPLASRLQAFRNSLNRPSASTKETTTAAAHEHTHAAEDPTTRERPTLVDRFGAFITRSNDDDLTTEPASVGDPAATQGEPTIARGVESRVTTSRVTPSQTPGGSQPTFTQQDATPAAAAPINSSRRAYVAAAPPQTTAPRQSVAPSVTVQPQANPNRVFSSNGLSLQNRLQQLTGAEEAPTERNISTNTLRDPAPSGPLPEIVNRMPATSQTPAYNDVSTRGAGPISSSRRANRGQVAESTSGDVNAANQGEGIFNSPPPATVYGATVGDAHVESTTKSEAPPEVSPQTIEQEWAALTESNSFGNGESVTEDSPYTASSATVTPPVIPRTSTPPASSANTASKVVDPYANFSSSAARRNATTNSVAEDSSVDSSIVASSRPLPITTATTKPSSYGATQANLLVSRRSPTLRVDVAGPSSTLVGKASPYRVIVANTGDIAASGVVVSVMIPTWADLSKSEATVGAAVSSSASLNGDGDYHPLEWKLPTLEPGASEQLSLELTPRSSRRFDLAVQYTVQPVITQAMVEVREPKLQMTISGPKEVLYGEKQLYRLTLANPGTGPAENIALQVFVGQGKGQTATQNIGELAAGGSKTIELELEARQQTGVMIRAQALADGGISTEAIEEILVRRAGLLVNIAGPRRQYAQADARYVLQVVNPGNAQANDVQVAVNLPPDAEFVSGSHGAEYDEQRRQVSWLLGNIQADVDERIELVCRFSNAGDNAVRVGAMAEGNLTDSKSFVTDIVTVADLVLEISDPIGVVPVGQMATYKVSVRNRGTKAAEGVEMFAHFSAGIEPVGVSGGQAKMHPGQVEFSPIKSLPAGGELKFEIRAKAQKAGSHTILVEVNSPSLDTKLSAMETTRFALADAALSEAAYQVEVENGVEYIEPTPLETDSEDSTASANTPTPMAVGDDEDFQLVPLQ